jgi:tripartite ATP-independent transporter DctM subunit
MLFQAATGSGYEWLSVLMFAGFFFVLMSGYPVGFGFAGTAIVFGIIGMTVGAFNFNLTRLLPNKWFGTMSDIQLIAIPFFIFLGSILEKSGLAEELLEATGVMLGGLKGGLALAVVLVGTLLAATTGVVAATIIAMGMISLPTMLKYGYDKKLATGTIMAAGTLAQMIPPSLVLVLLSDQLGIGVGDLFAGAIIPGLLMSASYAIYAVTVGYLRDGSAPALPLSARNIHGKALAFMVIKSFVPTMLIIFSVLGFIFAGLATPTEAGAVGAAAAVILSLIKGKLTWKVMKDASNATMRTTSLVIIILFCSTFFVTVFGGLGGQGFITNALLGMPGGLVGFIIVANIAIFLLGVFLEFVEITYLAMPLLVPAALKIFESGALPPYAQNVNEAMIWFAIIMAVNLQIAFISPPVGFSLFYMQSVAPKDKISTADIHSSAIPYVILQLIALVIVSFVPQLSIWLPRVLYSSGP